MDGKKIGPYRLFYDSIFKVCIIGVLERQSFVKYICFNAMYIAEKGSDCCSVLQSFGNQTVEHVFAIN